MLAYQCEQCPSMGAFYESSLDSLDPHSLPILSTSKIVPFDAFFSQMETDSIEQNAYWNC